MRLEIILFFITAFLIGNIYTEGKLLKLAFSFKKYYQMVAIIIAAFFFYYMIKKNPLNAGQMLSTTNDYLKYLPIDKGTSSILSPILDFTSKQNYSGDSNINEDGRFISMPSAPHNSYTKKIMTSGGSPQPIHQQPQLINDKKTKRSVSETKKKFVASRQGWKCGNCEEQLNAWFEVDHKIRLEHGGSNHIDNLVALCRECHGRKTTIENL